MLPAVLRSAPRLQAARRRAHDGGSGAGWLGRAAAAAAAAVTAAAAGLSAVAADAHEGGPALLTDKLACHLGVAAPRAPAVLVSCGSFNPPTIAHLRMFDLATAALAQRGYDVWGCYMSPVADGYGKQGLAPVQQRLAMCQMAAAGTDNVMVDGWEAAQPGFTRTLQVLRHVSDGLAAHMQQAQQQPGVQPDFSSRVHAAGLVEASAHQQQPGLVPPVPRVMLLCGADLLATMAQPGVWKDPDAILRDHGVVCVVRAGTDVAALLQQPGSVLAQQRERIIVVEEPVSNGISSSKVRALLAAGQPVRYLVPDAVLAFIRQQGLYNTA